MHPRAPRHLALLLCALATAARADAVDGLGAAALIVYGPIVLGLFALDAWLTFRVASGRAGRGLAWAALAAASAQLAAFVTPLSEDGWDVRRLTAWQALVLLWMLALAGFAVGALLRRRREPGREARPAGE